MLKTPSFRRYRKHPDAVRVRFLKHENMGNSDKVKIKKRKNHRIDPYEASLASYGSPDFFFLNLERC
jgi:hypothetical protein